MNTPQHELDRRAELEAILLTCDGKGKQRKREALDEIIRRERHVAYGEGYQEGKKNAPLPESIQEALNSGDGVYRP